MRCTQHDELWRLREADPLGGAEPTPVTATDAAWEDLLTRLPTAQSRRRVWRRERPLTLGLGALGAALAATGAAAVAFATLPGNGPVRLRGSEARLALARAAQVLAPGGGDVLYTAMSTEQAYADGSRERWSYRSWQQTSRPWDSRNVYHQSSGVPEQEIATVAGRMELYDPARDTIYTNETLGQPYTLRPAGRPGLYVLTLPAGKQRQSLTITAAEANAIRAGTDTVVYQRAGRQTAGQDATTPQVEPYSQTENPPYSYARAALALLRSPTAVVERNARLDGRPALRIAGTPRSSSLMRIKRAVYYVNPRTYAPLELIYQVAANSANHAFTLTERFSAYRRLRGTPRNLALVTLQGAHPGARVDTSRADYRAAENRIFR